MKSKQIIFSLFTIICFSVSVTVFAAQFETIGQTSTNLIDVAFGVKMIVRTMFIIAGSAFFMGGLYHYIKHRQNSVEYRISTAIVLVVLGVCLIIISFLPMTM